MIVNGTDVRTKYGFNVVWLSQTINPRTVNVYNNRLDGAIDPAKYKKTKYTEFEIYIEMLVKSESKEDCEKLMSSLMADFESGIVQLDDMEFLYKFDMAKEQRELKKRWLYHYELTLTGHAKLGKPVNESFTGTKYTTTIKGTAETPSIRIFVFLPTLEIVIISSVKPSTVRLPNAISDVKEKMVISL